MRASMARRQTRSHRFEFVTVQVIGRITDSAQGIAAEVSRRDDGKYVVAYLDTHAGETLPTKTICDDIDAAKLAAQSFINGEKT